MKKESDFMIFVKFSTRDGWWEYSKEKQRCYNFYCGGFPMLEKDEEDIIESLEAEDWHQLYIKTGFCPLVCDETERTCWLSFEGVLYKAEAHEVAAQDILKILDGSHESLYAAGDTLIERGWLKLTTSMMWEIYLNSSPTSWFLSQEQIDTLHTWCDYHKIEYPDWKIENFYDAFPGGTIEF